MVSLHQVSVSTTQAPQFVDITDAVQREVDASGVREGVALLRSRHTTAALTCTEGEPPGQKEANALYSETDSPRSYSLEHAVIEESLHRCASSAERRRRLGAAGGGAVRGPGRARSAA